MTIQSTDTSRILVVLLFAAVMTALLSQGDVDRRVHDFLQTAMFHTSDQDNRINQELILLRHHDHASSQEMQKLLDTSTQALDQVVEHLHTISGVQPELELLVKRLKQVMQDKRSQIEDFLTRRTHLVSGRNDFSKKIEANLQELASIREIDAEQARQLEGKLAQLRLFAQSTRMTGGSPGTIPENDIRAQQNNLVMQLIKLVIRTPGPLQNKLEETIGLSQELFRTQDELDDALHRLLAMMPLRELTQEIIHRSSLWVEQEQKQANRNRFLLYFAAMVLLALLLFLLYQNRRVSRQWLRMTRAVESTADAIALIDLQGVVGYANPSFQPLTGWSPRDAMGKKHRDLLTGLDDAMNEQLWQTLHRGEEWRGTLFNQKWTGSANQPGEPFWCQVTVAPIRNEQGILEGAVVSHHDITELQAIQDQLMAASREAEEANRAKSEFLANMSHEIRTPMNAIIGLTKLCLRTEVTQKQRDYLTKIDTSSHSLLRIINDILDFSKIEAGRLEMEAAPFRLDDVMFNVAAIVSLPVQDKGLELLFRLDPNIPRNLVGDSYRLEQVLINLVNNAVKFTSDGEVVVSTETLQRTEDKVTIQFSVQDTGIGMSDDQIAKLFRTFSQVDASTTRRFGGTGLGLAICKRLVELMHGHIQVTSTPGQGSTFLFTADFVCKTTETRAQSYAPPRNIKGLKVMVIDDNAMARTILKQMLEGFSMDVTTEKSGLSAVDALIAQGEMDHPFELVFVDWKMPGLNGLETIKRIRSSSLRKTPRIIMMTAFDDPKIRQGAESVGLDGFLTKPVSHSSLLDAIMVAFGEEGRVPHHATIDPDILASQFSDKFRGARILLVEDNEINQQVAQELLEGAGIAVDWAENGQKAVIMVEKAHYDCILMDLQMPVLDGYGATEKIRAKDGFNRLPIIAMTANAMAGEREKCLAAGMNDYVSKPIDLQQLFTTLARWLDVSSQDHVHMEITTPSEKSSLEWEYPDIPDVDHRFGLNRVGGNVKLYVKLLVKFAESYQDCGQQVGQAIARGDVAEAKRIVHTIKGLAGNIGCRSLQKASLSLEQAMETGQENALADRLRRFEKITSELADNINRAMKATIPKKPEDQASSTPLVCHAEMTPYREILQRLEPGVKTGKPGICKPILAEIETLAWPDGVKDSVEEMIKQIKRYKYKDAHNTLAHILENIGGREGHHEP
ncbi:MAG: response regulator [Magnetococcales bacterium]|nr:response regulator [Magnetococcales bacterium]